MHHDQVSANNEDRELLRRSLSLVPVRASCLTRTYFANLRTMSAMLLSGQTCLKPVVGSAPALHRARAFRSCRPQYNRHVVMMAERPRQDDNPADKAAAQVEDKLAGFVEQTKENSGLFQDTISQQPGNKTGAKGSPVDESGKAGGAHCFFRMHAGSKCLCCWLCHCRWRPMLDRNMHLMLQRQCLLAVSCPRSPMDEALWQPC